MDTTLYVDYDVKLNLAKGAEILNISISELAKILIKKSCNLNTEIIINNRLTEYQNHNPVNGFVQFHLKLSDDDNKFFKMNKCRLELSVSKMLLIGFLLFFGKLIKKIKRINKCITKIYNSYTFIYLSTYFSIESFLVKIRKTRDTG